MTTRFPYDRRGGSGTPNLSVPLTVFPALVGVVRRQNNAI
jgi:hypothetical protein